MTLRRKRAAGACVALALLALVGGVVRWRADETAPRPDSLSTLSSPTPSRAGPARAVSRDAGDACPFAFVPSSPGTRLTYRLESSQGEGEMTLELLAWDTRLDEVVATWRSTLSVAGNTTQSEYGRRCSADRGAEEPWFGYGAGAAIRFVDQGWRWRSLEPGTAFGGTVSVSVAGSVAGSETRRHRVAGVEEVHVPAGVFHATRVEVEDSQGEVVFASTYWISERVGMVRSEQHLGSDTLVHELVDLAGVETRPDS